MIPLVILDTTERRDVAEFIRVHEYVLSGDVEVTWAQLAGHKGTISLVLKFLRPAEVGLIVEFDITHQGILVDQALTSKGLYIQAGKPGDRLSTTLDNPRVLVHLEDTGFSGDWGPMFHKHIALHFRALGSDRSESKRLAQECIRQMREMGDFRIPR